MNVVAIGRRLTISALTRTAPGPRYRDFRNVADGSSLGEETGTRIFGAPPPGTGVISTQAAVRPYGPRPALHVTAGPGHAFDAASRPGEVSRPRHLGRGMRAGWRECGAGLPPQHLIEQPGGQQFADPAQAHEA